MTSTVTQGRALTRDRIGISYTHMTAPAGAPRVVFVHSLALDRSLWDPLAGLLAGEVEMLSYDCRGHGRSEAAPGPYSTGQFADDLDDLLAELGWDRVAIVGCSMGGCVAQQFAADHPDRTTAALFVDTTAWYGPQALEHWSQRAQQAATNGLASLLPFQLTRWFGDAFREREPELLGRLTKIFLANRLDCYQATCAMLGAADLRDRLTDINCPTAVLVGEDDQATPPAMAQALAEGLRIASATVVPGTRHLTPLEDPGVVVGALRGLLRAAASAPPVTAFQGSTA